MSEFHFSPRENRAHEIAWMSWGAEAFARAAAEDKPVLLAISAVWCHWCHVMDETSYSDPGVIAAINERFVPVRVDNDRRPDVNARYNMGGWPTTAFLSPDGSPITGATYLPPQQMRRALDEIADFYASHKAEIAERARELGARRTHFTPVETSELRASMAVRVAEELAGAYDAQYGGFGDEPKFPQPEVLEFLLCEWRVTGEARYYEMVAHTMAGMSRGGMYDHVEGGFFRYSTTRDWSVPHFEKMAEDHAGLLRVLAALVREAPNEYRATLVSAASYVRDVLRDPQTGFFAGSQDADEAYFALPLEERRKRTAPYVDRTSYTNWTCALAGAGCAVAVALDDDGILARACQTLDRVHALLLDDEGLAYHYVVPGAAPQVRGLLVDQSAYLRALLDAHEASGEARFLERAQALAARIAERFEADDGGFYDRAAGEESLGRLGVADRPIVENGLLAESLLRLAALTGEPAYRERAGRTLALYARTYAGAGSFAATYARALRRYLSEELSVKIVGDPAATADFREAARRLPGAFTAVRTVAPGKAGAAGLPPVPAPAAYLCRGTTCGAPVDEAGRLREAYEAIAAG
ncbi:MAG TPA: DUF255 domain-containing protein [Verrucomicrobiae bacterium]|nr:DUF255 domain-containing protein [Verrucomicrobiae bacterium]